MRASARIVLFGTLLALATGCVDKSTTETPPTTDPPQNWWGDVLSLPDPSTQDNEDAAPSDTPPLIVLWDGNTGDESPTDASQPSGQDTPSGPGGGEDGSDKPPSIPPPQLTELPSQPLPTTLGAGFVDISGEVTSDPKLHVDQGSPEDPQDNPEMTHGVFGDLNGDGFPEVVIEGSGCCKEGSDPLVYQYDAVKGELVHAPELEEALPPALKFGPVAGILDINGDGHMDVLTSRGDETLFLADGQGGWLPPISPPTPPDYPYDGFRTKGAIGVADLDQNGLLDILMGDSCCDDTCGSLLLMMQVTPGVFEARMDLLPQQPPADPYAVLGGPLGPPGETVLQVLGRPCNNANPHHGFYRQTELDSAGYPLYELFDPFPLEAEFKSFSEASFGYFTKVNPMGATVGDLSLDGILDLVATYSTPQQNYWSARGKTPSPSFGVFQGLSEWPVYDRSSMANAGPPLGIADYNMIPWGNALLDLNGDGLSDLVTAHGPDADGINDPTHWVGPQHCTVHMATGLFEFGDVTALSGVDRPGHWRSITVGDIDLDGDPDLVAGGNGEAPITYRNDLDVANNRLAIRLKGHTSNSMGYGARVLVEGEQPVPGQQLLMGHIGSPQVLSEGLVFAGVGPANKADKVTILWPSGYLQEVVDLEAGMVHTIEEPPLITLTPTSRRVPADGEGFVSILVTPRDVSGTLLTEANVDVDLVFGTGQLSDVVADSFGWKAILSAPSESGSAVLEVTINGVPLAVRPRVVWE